MLRKKIDTNPRRYEDTHPMGIWLLSDDTYPMKNDQLVSKSSIKDGADKVEYL